MQNLDTLLPLLVLFLSLMWTNRVVDRKKSAVEDRETRVDAKAIAIIKACAGIPEAQDAIRKEILEK